METRSRKDLNMSAVLILNAAGMITAVAGIMAMLLWAIVNEHRVTGALSHREPVASLPEAQPPEAPRPTPIPRPVRAPEPLPWQKAA
jgi:hypothetical protein